MWIITMTYYSDSDSTLYSDIEGVSYNKEGAEEIFAKKVERMYHNIAEEGIDAEIGQSEGRAVITTLSGEIYRYEIHEVVPPIES